MVIGFEQPLYSVNESAGSVSIGVVVQDGQLRRSVIVTVLTEDGTAQSKWCVSCAWTSTISIWQSSIRYMCAYAVVYWYRALFCSDDMHLNNISVLHVWTAHAFSRSSAMWCGDAIKLCDKMLSEQDLFLTHFQFLIYYYTNMFVCDSHVKNLNLSTQYTVYLRACFFYKLDDFIYFTTTLRWFWLHYQDTNTDIWPEQYGFQCHCSSAW